MKHVHIGIVQKNLESRTSHRVLNDKLAKICTKGQILHRYTYRILALLRTNKCLLLMEYLLHKIQRTHIQHQHDCFATRTRIAQTISLHVSTYTQIWHPEHCGRTLWGVADLLVRWSAAGLGARSTVRGTARRSLKSRGIDNNNNFKENIGVSLLLEFKLTDSTKCYKFDFLLHLNLTDTQ